MNARLPLRAVAVVALAAGFVGVFGRPAAGQAPAVLVSTVEGVITPVMAGHLADGRERAEREGYSAHVIRLDTPGGLDTSMRQIIQGILASRVPVIVYVSPEGARAASAGAIITIAGHVAAMSPGTAIGAATPVDLGGGDVERKILQDAAAYAESLARLRDRDVTFAREAVLEGRSVAAVEAVEIGAVDLIASDLPALLDTVDGRTVMVQGQEVALRTAGAVVDDHDLGLFGRIQQRLADPNIAFLFMSLGTLALIYELASPGLGVGAALGVMFLLVALFSLAVLPVNAVGLLFLLLAAILFVVELFAPGVGLGAAGGTAALVLSGIFLFRGTPDLQVSLAVLGPVAAVTGVGSLVAGRLALRARRGPVVGDVGPGGLVGRDVKLRQAWGREGQVFIDGSWWRVRSRGGELEEGTSVRVVDVDGLFLVVEPTAAGDRERTAADNRENGGS